MRISEIKIQNIASLKGVHNIRFEQIANDLNLFAITGPTGSGKSTILNSIALALYGSHYKKSVSQADMVTIGEKQASVDLYFQFQNKQYLAHWEARVRKNNGELLKLPKTIRTLFVEVAGKYEPIEKTAQDILHLSFDQFCKTVILNQGEFSKFLTSNFRERKEILEKLYQGQYLEKLSLNLRAQINSVNSEIKEIDIEVQALEHGDEEDYGSLEQELKQKDSIINMITTSNKLFEKLQSEIFDIYDQSKKTQSASTLIAKLECDLTDQTAGLNTIKAQLTALKSDFEQLQQKFDVQRPMLQKCLVWKNQITELKLTISKNKKKIESVYESRQKVSQEIISSEEKLKDSNKSYLLRKENYHLTSLNDEDIEQLQQLRNKLKNITAQKKHFEASIHFYTEGQEQIKTKMKLAKEELEKLSAKNLEKEGNSSFKEQIQQIEKRIDVLQEQSIKIKGAKQKTEDLLSSNMASKKNNDINSSKIQENISLLNIVSNKIDILKLEEKKKQLEFAVSKCIEHLKQDDKCPVCEQVVKEIPFNSQGPKISSLQSNTDELLKQQNTLKLAISSIEQDAKRDSAQIKENLVKLNSLALELYRRPLGSEELLSQIMDSEQSAKNEIKAKQIALASTRERQQVYMQKQSRIEFLNEQKSKLDKEQKEVDKKLSETIQFRINTQDIINELRIQIYAMINFCPLEEDLSEFIQKQLDEQMKINELRSQISTIEVAIENLHEKNKLLFDESKELKIQASEQRVKLEQLNEQLKEKIANQDPEKLLDLIHEELDSKKKKLDLIKQKLSAKELMVKEVELRIFQQQEQKKQLSLNKEMSIDTTKEISTKLNSYSSSDLASIVPQQQLERLLAPFSGDSIFEDDIEALEFYYKNSQSIFAELFERTKEFIQRKIEVETLMTRYLKVRNTIDKKSKQRAVINKKLERFGNLNSLIGKDEFRNFVLSHIEQTLIEQTNIELDSLCQGRYQLIQLKKKGEIPEFYVIDKLKGGIERKISTLSGGETFMVSLSMALALSELTKGQTDIDSFFIDEGFATLDKESLEDVIEILNSMRNRGKQIGVISHLEHLTSRLPVNIHLKKDNWGHSNIDIIYH